MNQLAADGLYRGGNIPFGYRLVWHDRTNKAGKPVHDLEIDPVNANVVRRIFEVYLDNDYGTHKIASYLNHQGILSGTRKRWHPDRIHYLLKNRTYMGIIRNGQTESDIIHELQIIIPDHFNQVQNKMAERARIMKPLPAPTTYEPLFAGKVRCGYCGEVMGIRCTSARYKTRAGEQQIYRDKSYTCKSKSQCKPKSVNAELVDQAIIETATSKIMKLKTKEIRQIKTPEYNARLTCLSARLSETSSKLESTQIELSHLDVEMHGVIATHDFETLELLDKQKEVLLSQISSNEDDVASLRQQYAYAQKEREQYRKDIRLLLALIKQFDAFSAAEQVDFLRSIIECVKVYGKRVPRIVWSRGFHYIF